MHPGDFEPRWPKTWVRLRHRGNARCQDWIGSGALSDCERRSTVEPQDTPISQATKMA